VNADRWQGLEIRHLIALKAVIAEGSFAAAAEQLGYTQSAVSQQIAALERIVGAPLLERPRGRRPTGLTEAGQVIVRHADALLARVRAARADVESLSQSGGVLRVGTYESVGVRILPQVLLRFASEWPNETVQFREAPGDAELLELVANGELDLTFAMLPPLDGPFESVPLLHDPYVLVVAAGSPLATKSDPIVLADLAKLPLITLRSCRNEERVEAQLRRRGVDPHVVFRSDHNGTVQAMAGASVGVALVPRLTMDEKDDRTVLRELHGLVLDRVLGLVRHRDRSQSPAAAAFTEVALTVCSRLNPPTPAPYRTEPEGRDHYAG
jgi:molybdate transport repressor ModE-like protein